MNEIDRILNNSVIYPGIIGNKARFINLHEFIDYILSQIANILSWIGAVIFAYITNRKYVFESKNKNILKECSSFFGARIITLIMDIVIMFVGVTLLKQNDKIFKILSQVVVIVSNYLFSKIFVFKKEA